METSSGLRIKRVFRRVALTFVYQPKYMVQKLAFGFSWVDMMEFENVEDAIDYIHTMNKMELGVITHPNNSQKGKFFKSYDKEIAINGKNKESGKVTFVSLLKTEIEMFTASGEKVYMRIKEPISQKE